MRKKTLLYYKNEYKVIIYEWLVCVKNAVEEKAKLSFNLILRRKKYFKANLL